MFNVLIQLKSKAVLKKCRYLTFGLIYKCLNKNNITGFCRYFTFIGIFMLNDIERWNTKNMILKGIMGK